MQIKTMKRDHTPTRMAQIHNTDRTQCWRGMRHGAATLEDRLAASYKTEYTVTIQSNIYALWYLPKVAENLCPHKNLHMDVYGSFIHSCQNLEANKISSSR